MGFPGGQLVLLGLAALFFGAVAVRSARRLATVVRMLRRGTRAAGTCVRVERGPNRNSDSRRYRFAFRTADGERVEFEDMAGWSMAAGDDVTVAYDPRDPRRTATIAGRGSHSPVLQGLALAAGCSLAAAGFTALLLFQLLGGS